MQIYTTWCLQCLPPLCTIVLKISHEGPGHPLRVPQGTTPAGFLSWNWMGLYLHNLKNQTYHPNGAQDDIHPFWCGQVTPPTSFSPAWTPAAPGSLYVRKNILLQNLSTGFHKSLAPFASGYFLLWTVLGDKMIASWSHNCDYPWHESGILQTSEISPLLTLNSFKRIYTSYAQASLKGLHGLCLLCQPGFHHWSSSASTPGSTRAQGSKPLSGAEFMTVISIIPPRNKCFSRRGVFLLSMGFLNCWVLV